LIRQLDNAVTEIVNYVGIVARAPIQRRIAPNPNESIVPDPSVQNAMSVGCQKIFVGLDVIIACPTIEGIVACSPIDKVVAIPSIHNVVTPVWPRACQDSIIASPTIDRIIAIPTV